MFGYLVTYTPELKVRENEFYKAAYCGLCRSMGKCTGQCSRFTLSYDMTFLSIIRMAVTGHLPAFSKKTCVAHPFRKRMFVKRCDELDFCAYASALLVHYKCIDDINDESGKKRFRAKLAKTYTSKMRKKTCKKYPELDLMIADRLEKLSQVEKSCEKSIDIPADIFGGMMAEIASWGLDGAPARIAHSVGFSVGKWLYITDAIDDMSDDKLHGRYNPIVNMLSDSSDGAWDIFKGSLENALMHEAMLAGDAIDLIDWNGRANMQGVSENIVYMGLQRNMRHVLYGEDFIPRIETEKHKPKGGKTDENTL